MKPRFSWGDIAQNSTKRRPASAPTVKRDFARPGEFSSAGGVAGARLSDVSARKDGQMSFFRRTEEIRAVVGIMREAEKVREPWTKVPWSSKKRQPRPTSTHNFAAVACTDTPHF